MTTRPRIPGSQVAPGQRPYNSGAPTASTHSKVPLHEATAGRLYRVRDKDWAAVHGENLSWDEATKLKEKLVGARMSTTARVEDMEVEPPDWYIEQCDQAAEAAMTEETSAAPSMGADHAGVADPELEALRAPAIAAARQAAQAAQGRADARQRPRIVPAAPAPVSAAPKAGKFTAPVRRPAAAPAPGPRIVPRDKTVQPLVQRTAPPPRDRTVASEIVMRASPPPASEPLPLISPLAAAAIPDDPLDVPDNQIVDDDLADLTADLGGGASDSDIQRAKQEAEEQRRAGG